MNVTKTLIVSTALALVAGAPAYAKTKPSTPAPAASTTSTDAATTPTNAAPSESATPAQTSTGMTSSTSTQPASGGVASAGATTGAAAPGAGTPGVTAQNSLSVGAQVKDTSGQPVGTVEAVDGDVATVSTATTQSKVRIPVSSFANSASGPVLAMTATQLDAAAKAAAPAAQRQ
jgi:hypothetical protein